MTIKSKGPTVAPSASNNNQMPFDYFSVIIYGWVRPFVSPRLPKEQLGNGNLPKKKWRHTTAQGTHEFE